MRKSEIIFFFNRLTISRRLQHVYLDDNDRIILARAPHPKTFGTFNFEKISQNRHILGNFGKKQVCSILGGGANFDALFNTYLKFVLRRIRKLFPMVFFD